MLLLPFIDLGSILSVDIISYMKATMLRNVFVIIVYSLPLYVEVDRLIAQIQNLEMVITTM